MATAKFGPGDGYSQRLVMSEAVQLGAAEVVVADTTEVPVA
jgi:hypothetical protein